MTNKTVFLIAAMLAFQLHCVAQSVVITEPHNVRTISSGIREWNYPVKISYVNQPNDTVTFIYMDTTMQTVEISIVGYVVNDMAIAEDTVFFCGQNKNTKEAMAGYFDINDVFFASGNINIQDHLSVSGFFYISNLTRLEVYKDTWGIRHMYCVGNLYSGHSCLFEKTDFQMGVWQIGWLNTKYETLTDVKIVKDNDGTDYLVTSGYETTNGTYISLRIYDPADIFAYSGMQDHRYVFSSNPLGVRPWKQKDVLLTAMKRNTLATLSYRSSNLFANNDDRAHLSCQAHVALYDVSLLAQGNLFAMTNSIEIPVPALCSNVNPHEFIHNADGYSLAFLHYLTLPNSSGNSTPFFEIDYTSTGLATAVRRYTHPDNILLGMDRYNGGTQYLLNGYSRTNDIWVKYETETFGNSSSCAEMVQPEFVKVSPMGAVEDIEPFDNMGVIGEIVHPETIWKRFPLWKECEE